MEKNRTKTVIRTKASVRIRAVTYCALLVALEIVLSRFCSINTSGWKIGFSFIPVTAASILFGPFAGAVVGGLGDLIGALLFPIGPYFPGFTICAAWSGFMYGLFLYRGDDETMRKAVGAFSLFKADSAVKLVHVIIPVLINSIVIGLFINTIWVSILYGSKTYWGWFIYRLPEYALMIPVRIIIIPIIVRLCGELKKTAIL